MEKENLLSKENTKDKKDAEKAQAESKSEKKNSQPRRSESVDNCTKPESKNLNDVTAFPQ